MRYLYYILTNGKVIAPFENEIDDIFDNHHSSCWYETKSGKLVHKFTYGDEIDFDDCLGKAVYSHYSTEREYLGKIKAKFKTISELVEYIKKEHLK